MSFQVKEYFESKIKRFSSVSVYVKSEEIYLENSWTQQIR